ncbi:hypothetical protein LXL04_004490 [Taraxacum kok-saghyz]
MGPRENYRDKWTKVEYRKGRQYGDHRSSGGRTNGSSRVSTSLFITNFLHSIKPNDIWTVASRMGHVVDVYISPHLSRVGKRFGFVRFVEVSDIQRIIAMLNDTWFGFYKLFAAVPRYPQETKHDPKPKQQQPFMHATQQPPNVHAMKSKIYKPAESFTYASVVRGTETVKGDAREAGKSRMCLILVPGTLLSLR